MELSDMFLSLNLQTKVIWHSAFTHTVIQGKACHFYAYYLSLTNFIFPLSHSLCVSQMAFTASALSVCCGFSSLRRRCSAAASLCDSRTCPRSTSCPRCSLTSWKGCQQCFQSLLMMCLCLTCSRMQMQERCSTLVSPRHCREGSFSHQRLWRSSCTSTDLDLTPLHIWR